MYAFNTLPLFYQQYLYPETLTERLLISQDEDEPSMVPVVAIEYVANVYKTQGQLVYPATEHLYTYYSTHLETPEFRRNPNTGHIYIDDPIVGQYTGDVNLSIPVHDTQTTVYLPYYDIQHSFLIGVLHVLTQVFTTYENNVLTMHVKTLQILHSTATTINNIQLTGVLCFPVDALYTKDLYYNYSMGTSTIYQQNYLSQEATNTTGVIPISGVSSTEIIKTYLGDLESWIYYITYIPLQWYVYEYSYNANQAQDIITEAWHRAELAINSATIPFIPTIPCYFKGNCLYSSIY